MDTEFVEKLEKFAFEKGVITERMRCANILHAAIMAGKDLKSIDFLSDIQKQILPPEVQ